VPLTFDPGVFGGFGPVTTGVFLTAPPHTPVSVFRQAFGFASLSRSFSGRVFVANRPSDAVSFFAVLSFLPRRAPFVPDITSRRFRHLILSPPEAPRLYAFVAFPSPSCSGTFFFFPGRFETARPHHGALLALYSVPPICTFGPPSPFQRGSNFFSVCKQRLLDCEFTAYVLVFRF